MEKVEETEPKISKTKTLLIIEGIRENGSKFRPSDWPERISSTFAGFGKDQRLHYSPCVSPRVHNGQKVLAMEIAMQEKCPAIYQAVLKFARENNLRTREESITLE